MDGAIAAAEFDKVVLIGYSFEAALSLATTPELLAVGREAWKNAPRPKSPALVIQGRFDEVATENNTRELYARLPDVSPPTYIEVPSGHDLIKPETPAGGRRRRRCRSLWA